MFDVNCPRHGHRILLGPRSIESLANTPDGVVVHWRCRCGATGTRHFGAPASPRAARGDAA